MFLTENDYDTLILDEDRLLISKETLKVRQDAEGMAIDQISGFIRNKYNVQATFALQGDARSKVLVMYTMDIALYHLHSSVPGRFVPEIRRIRYEDALSWLKDIAKGLISPDFPLITDPETGETVTGPAFIYGSSTKQDNSW